MASFAPFGTSIAVDYLIEGTGALEVKLLGAVPLVRVVGGPDLNRGEALRYLAQLPWNPDAIVGNGADTGEFIYWQGRILTWQAGVPTGR